MHRNTTITVVANTSGLIPLVILAVSLTGTLSASGGEVPFTEHLISTTADLVKSVYATDLDGDGDIDVVSASQNDNKIAWYESDGGSPPSFTEHVITNTASGAVRVFAADMNGDGDTDVISGSSFDDTVAWYESDGGSPPNFTERLISTTADGAGSVFAIDVDGDTDIDVVSTHKNANKIVWYESSGGLSPSFTEQVISTVALDPVAVFATDLDGDGDVDILSASEVDDKISWYESDGGSPPSFTERVISTNADFAFAVFATDLDGDGDIDVLSASILDDKIAWYESDGGLPPSFTERVISNAELAPEAVFAADVDGDGDIDVLSAAEGDDKIMWYENDGSLPPSFTAHVITSTADGAGSVFATDVDGDGDIDVLSASFFDDTVAWYENTTQCGDSVINGAEVCDDGNVSSGDGCDSTCQVEPGFICQGEPSVCFPEGIPTVSEWGLIALCILVLTGGTLAILSRKSAVA